MSKPTEWAFPASYGQERLWLASRLQPESSVYNVVMQVLLPSGVDAATVLPALAEVVVRHEALRTSFRHTDAGLLQVVHPDVPVEVPVDDLRDLPPDAVEQRYYQLCLASAQAPFALDRPPLWRARLIRAGDDDLRLVLVAHHTICDGTSNLNLDAELAELCRAATEQRAPRLPDLDIQYADWAVWQREKQLTTARMEKEVAYWRARLAGLPAVHSLPTDRPRLAAQDHSGAEIRFEIPADLAERVTQLARRLRVTEFAVLFAAYAALLARLGGHPDVVVGAPVAGRDTEQVAPLIGMFVNTVPLRVDTSSDPTFEALAGQVAQTTLEALEHAAVPVQCVIEELVPRRDPAVPPLYQIGFNHLPNIPLNSGYGTARDEFALELSGREGRLEYRTNLFDANTAQAIVSRYLRVLDAVTRRPDIRVSRLPLLDEAERTLLLGRGSAGDAEADGESAALGVHEQILAQAARTPDAVAVTTAAGSLSYRALADRVRVLAARLRERGVGPEQLVAIALPRSPDLVVAVLAVLVAGGGYVPLDPAQPAERLAFILTDSGAAVVLTSAEHRHRLPETTAVVLDVAEQGLARAALDSAGPNNVAYVIYTSGSTGRPKGSAIEHRSLANYVRWFVRQLELDASDRVLSSSSPSFDAFGNELFPTLVAGGTIVVAPETAGFDPDALLRLAAEHDVTRLAVVPSTLRLLLDAPAFSLCTQVRHVVCGGEQLSGELAARLPVPLYNIYGPTETTIGVSFHIIRPTDRYHGAVPIGRPLANARLYVLDDAGEPAPVGVVGHLHVGGLPVGRGYPGRPALTAERFVPDPFGPPGSRLYRTGDLARWTTVGVLMFMGRRDSQVKIRGLRIEPGEIESVLREQPGIRDAAVVAREDVPGDPRLVAYVLADEVDAGTLRAALRRSLPDYLVPAAIVALAAFPLTPSGKLDAAALPAADHAVRVRPYLVPRTASEELVAAVWAEVLGVEQVGAEDDFFDLGGHSLLAARIAVRLSDAVGVEVPIRLFFSHLSVAALAAAVEELLADEIDQLSEDEAERKLTGDRR